MAKRKLSGKEIAWDIIGSIFAVGGIGLIITNIVGSLLNVPLNDNVIYEAETKLTSFFKFRVTFLSLGFVALLLGVFILVVTLYHFAKKDDLVRDRELKRRQRLEAELNDQPFIEVTSEDVPSEEPVETPTTVEE